MPDMIFYITPVNTSQTKAKVQQLGIDLYHALDKNAQKAINNEETIVILSGLYSASELLEKMDKTQQIDNMLGNKRPVLPTDKTFIQHYPTLTAWNKNKEMMDATNKASDDENDDFILHSSQTAQTSKEKDPNIDLSSLEQESDESDSAMDQAVDLCLSFLCTF